MAHPSGGRRGPAPRADRRVPGQAVARPAFGAPRGPSHGRGARCSRWTFRTRGSTARRPSRRFVEDEAKWGLTGRRFRQLEPRYAIEPRGRPRLCVRYETVVEDSRVPGFPGAVFVLAARGLRCVHPYWPRYLVDVSYSQRMHRGQPLVPLEPEGEPFVGASGSRPIGHPYEARKSAGVRSQRAAMPRPCELARWVAPPSQSTWAPPAASLRLFSASPENHRRLSPELRGGILQAPWPPCAVADAVDRHRLSKPSCPARLILFRCAASNCDSSVSSLWRVICLPQCLK